VEGDFSSLHSFRLHKNDSSQVRELTSFSEHSTITEPFLKILAENLCKQERLQQ
jgi:hypothetical protein